MLLCYLAAVVLSGCSLPVVGHGGRNLERSGIGEETNLPQKSSVSRREQFPDLDVVDNAEVRHFTDYYLSTRRRFVEQSLERRKRYLPTMEQIFGQYGLPFELLNIALIESGFDPEARSPSGAVGMWQFMKRTGKQYGLAVGWTVDERKDYVKSTYAAARYLSDLFRIYGGLVPGACCV